MFKFLKNKFFILGLPDIIYTYNVYMQKGFVRIGIFDNLWF